MKYVVTGGFGFIGTHVAVTLVKEGHDVFVIDDCSSKSVQSPPWSDKCGFIQCDIAKPSFYGKFLEGADAVFHLAAHANVRASFTTPNTVLSNNILGTGNLFEAVRIARLDPIIQLCSTSEVYGQVAPENVPIKEDCPIAPSSPYAVSKVAQDLLGHTYYLSYGMQIIRTRMFAYLNPRRTDLFATSFAMQVARIEEGLQKELLHGNLDSVRTLIDVRDAMESYWVAMEKCKPGEVYNIGGRKAIKVGEFLDLLKKSAKTDIPSRVDKSLLRPADVTLQIPDVNKFQKETGWKPKYSFDESVMYLLDHCRNEVKKEIN